MIVGAGHKMYLGHRQCLEWMTEVARIAQGHPGVRSGAVELFVLPTFPMLTTAIRLLAPWRVRVGAQDLFWEDSGPYTGEVSGAELAEIGCTYVEVGHLERRTYFGEDDQVVSRKTAAAFRNGLTPVLCVGEGHEQDPDDAATECLRQLHAALAASRPAGTTGRLVVAYEPHWAIGAAASADAAYIRVVCARLRAAVDGDAALAGSRVIYGGSAGSGLLGRLGGEVDGLFLGRSSHQPEALAAVLDEALAAAGSA